MIGWLFRIFADMTGADIAGPSRWPDASPRPRGLTLPKNLKADELHAIHACEFCGRTFCTCHQLPLN